MNDVERCWAYTSDERCKRPATNYRCGAWCCPQHTPTGAKYCTHSLTADGKYCAYCGGGVD